jgi:hypothetical protein
MYELLTIPLQVILVGSVVVIALIQVFDRD